jgi:hypothetical protein
MVKIPKELRQNHRGATSGRTNKQCSIEACEEVAIRTLSKQKWESYLNLADLKIKETRNRNIYLCRQHYKSANKFRKSEEKITGKNIFTENPRFGKGSKKKAISPWDK